MTDGALGPLACCEDCLPAHRGDWDPRPNPYLLTDSPSPPCSFCGADAPSSLLVSASPIGAGAR